MRFSFFFLILALVLPCMLMALHSFSSLMDRNDSSQGFYTAFLLDTDLFSCVSYMGASVPDLTDVAYRCCKLFNPEKQHLFLRMSGPIFRSPTAALHSCRYSLVMPPTSRLF